MSECGVTVNSFDARTASVTATLSAMLPDRCHSLAEFEA